MEGKAKKDKWVWEGTGTSQKTIESLSWMRSYREPEKSEKEKKKDKNKKHKEETSEDSEDEDEGPKMGKKQIAESYDNFSKWFDSQVSIEVKNMREEQTKNLE